MGRIAYSLIYSGQVNKLAGEETKTCLFCHLNKKAGLNILDTFICSDCEKRLVRATCDDRAYQFYLQNLKKFWHEL
ncbi:MAG: inhibitor of sigma-G Gin [Firmicutes bacterium]|nr:inhibitor of sigma-G Gin [Bacillota bacterium]